MSSIRKERHTPTDFSNNMSSLKPVEALVEVNVVNMIIVAFRKQQLMFPWRKLELSESRG